MTPTAAPVTLVASPDRARATAVRAVARRYIDAAAPRSRHVELVATSEGRHVFVADGSRLYDVGEALFGELDVALALGRDDVVEGVLGAAGLGSAGFVDDAPLETPRVHALSLAVAQRCNLACTYCYAEQGDFGDSPKNMPLQTALSSVEMLVASAPPGSTVNLAFMGGEPLVNRAVLRAATAHALALAARRDVTATFSITTNGTLVMPDDAEFFEQHGFAVTVSVDGPRASHDLLRPRRDGRGSFDSMMDRVRPLLAAQRDMQVSARVTVTPRNLRLRETLDELVELGFHSVGFSPMLTAPGGRDEMQTADLEVMLGEMIDCGNEYVRRARAAQRYPFANVVNALREIGRGTHRPYPCGAGAGYLGVSADGALAACHRFVGDDGAAMGSVGEGVDEDARATWLTERHVHRQEPCRSCWARYLCGGGCHHEVIRRGRPSCDYIRGWLAFCIEAYLDLAPADVSPEGAL